jgi:hypothetical protein
MLRKLYTVLTIAVLFVITGKAQWENQGAWPDTSYKGQNHSMAVDPDGKVWASNFASDTTIISGQDTLTGIRTIKIFNPDGSHASFSPIVFVQGSGIDDTLGYNRLSKGAPTIGMRADHNGNILLVTGTRIADPPDATNILYRFNYQTGEAMNKVVLDIDASGHTTVIAPAVDGNGNIFVGPVFPNNPITMLDSDFNTLGPAGGIPGTLGFARTMEVSEDGNTIYYPAYSVKKIFIYSRASEFDDFALTDSITGAASESISWHPVTGDLWFSGGSYNDLPDSGSGYTPNTWYGYDVENKTVTDSLKWEFLTPGSSAERPRALAFSPDGNNAYIGCFGGAGYPLIQKLVNTGVDVKPEPNVVVKDYSLAQNYPNPFNPTTDIKFAVAKEGLVTLKVYDLLGKEVATLVNEQMPSGSYVADFDASNLASGTYIYTLTINGVSLSKKMMLLK